MHWWRRETFRQFVPLLPAYAGFFAPGDLILRIILFWDLWALGYLLLTWLAFRRLGPARLRAAMATERRRRLRWLDIRPEQLPQGAAAFALIATVLAMPRYDELGDAPSWLGLTACVVAVFTAWLSLQTGFALAYAARDTAHGGLDFPGEDEPGPVDYAYFAVAVGTSFGTPDVVVTRTALRRMVLVHGTLAFFFNAMIVASAVGLVTSRLAA